MSVETRRARMEIAECRHMGVTVVALAITAAGIAVQAAYVLCRAGILCLQDRVRDGLDGEGCRRWSG